MKRAHISGGDVTVTLETSDLDSMPVEALAALAAMNWALARAALPKPDEQPRQQLGYAAQAETKTQRMPYAYFGEGDQLGVR